MVVLPPPVRRHDSDYSDVAQYERVGRVNSDGSGYERPRNNHGPYEGYLKHRDEHAYEHPV